MPRRGGIIGVRGIWNNRWFNHDCFALSGRGLLWRRFPRALPGAGVFCPCGAGACARSEGRNMAAQGRAQRRPGTRERDMRSPVGAQHRAVCARTVGPTKVVLPFQGEGYCGAGFPGRCPGLVCFAPAGHARPCAPKERNMAAQGRAQRRPGDTGARQGKPRQGRNTARCLREPFVQPRLFCPFRARVVMASVSPGVARGWCVLPLRGMRVRALRRRRNMAAQGRASAALGRGKKTREAP